MRVSLITQVLPELDAPVLLVRGTVYALTTSLTGLRPACQRVVMPWARSSAAADGKRRSADP